MKLHPILLGTSLFVFQLVLVLSICPESTWTAAWYSLASHWDSEWYAAIAQYGYVNLDGPAHCGLKNANVVFFPGYPYLARILALVLHLQAKTALLLVSQAAAWLFWCILFYILRSLSWLQQFAAAILILVFPTSWFLLMGYSESLFMETVCLTIWWMVKKQWLRCGLMSIAMTATRLIGLPLVSLPFFTACFLKFSQIKLAVQNRDRAWLRQEMILPNLIVSLGILGCGGFLLYCAQYLGSWHLYFDMEKIHWRGTADPTVLWQIPTWLPPPWGYALDKAPMLPNIWSTILPFDFLRIAAYSLSEILVPVFMWLGLLFAYRIYKNRQQIDEKILLWFGAGWLMLLFSIFSLATRHFESMSRCLLPVWIVWVIGDALSQKPLFFLDKKGIAKSVFFLGWVFLSGCFHLEMLNRYFLGWWVA